MFQTRFLHFRIHDRRNNRDSISSLQRRHNGSSHNQQTFLRTRFNFSRHRFHDLHTPYSFGSSFAGGQRKNGD